MKRNIVQVKRSLKKITIIKETMTKHKCLTTFFDNYNHCSQYQTTPCPQYSPYPPAPSRPSQDNLDIRIPPDSQYLSINVLSSRHYVGPLTSLIEKIAGSGL